jgi:hypothetical protein
MTEKTISSSFTVAGSMADYVLEDAATKEKQTFTLDLSKLLAVPAEALKACANGVRIRMREATGGKTFVDAVALLEDFAAAVNAGAYPARQREAGETRSSPFMLALARVFYAGDAAKAQAGYDAEVADQAVAKGLSLDAEDDATVKAIRKLKADVRAEMLKNKRVAAAMETLKLEAATAALERQKARAAAAEAAAANE